MTDELPPLRAAFEAWWLGACGHHVTKGKFGAYFYADEESAWKAWQAADAAAVARERKAMPVCDRHNPRGGTYGFTCLICAGEKLQAALSRISYLCGEPNDMQCSDYDVHMNEDAVVEQVAAAIRKGG